MVRSDDASMLAGGLEALAGRHPAVRRAVATAPWLPPWWALPHRWPVAGSGGDGDWGAAEGPDPADWFG